MNKIRILVIEDDKRLAEVLFRGLQEAGMNIKIANDGESGFTMFQSYSFDLIITDLVLPKLNGFELCKRIRKDNPIIPIIMLTALGTTDEKVEGFDAGADDYLVKPFDFRELHARIKTLLKRAGSEYNSIPNKAFSYATLTINLKEKKAFREGQELNLTPKEYGLLKYMVVNAERILTREEIAKEVWDLNFDTGTNFIDVYINYLRKKVDKPFRSKLIHTRPGIGFILKQQ